MSTVLTLKDGRREYVFSNRDFAEFLNRELGLDAYKYFNDVLKDAAKGAIEDLDEEKILNEGWCSGECVKVQQTQEHFENLLKDCESLAREIYKTMMDGFEMGKRRTKREQAALDKAIQIIKVVTNNT